VVSFHLVFVFMNAFKCNVVSLVLAKNSLLLAKHSLGFSTITWMIIAMVLINEMFIE
jgi:hypothetical protein